MSRRPDRHQQKAGSVNNPARATGSPSSAATASGPRSAPRPSRWSPPPASTSTRPTSTSAPPATCATARSCPTRRSAELRGFDAILLGAVGPPVGDTTVPPGTLERGLLLRLRFELDLYVNLRPFAGVPGLDRRRGRLRRHPREHRGHLRRRGRLPAQGHPARGGHPGLGQHPAWAPSAASASPSIWRRGDPAAT